MNYIQFGPKKKHYLIPEGYTLLTGNEADPDSLPNKTDKFFNCLALRWQNLDNEDLTCPICEYEFIIRKS